MSKIKCTYKRQPCSTFTLIVILQSMIILNKNITHVLSILNIGPDKNFINENHFYHLQILGVFQLLMHLQNAHSTSRDSKQHTQ